MTTTKGTLDGGGYGKEKNLPAGTINVVYENNASAKDPVRNVLAELTGANNTLVHQDEAQYSAPTPQGEKS